MVRPVPVIETWLAEPELSPTSVAVTVTSVPSVAREAVADVVTDVTVNADANSGRTKKRNKAMETVFVCEEVMFMKISPFKIIQKKKKKTKLEGHTAVRGCSRHRLHGQQSP